MTKTNFFLHVFIISVIEILVIIWLLVLGIWCFMGFAQILSDGVYPSPSLPVESYRWP